MKKCKGFLLGFLAATMVFAGSIGVFAAATTQNLSATFNDIKIYIDNELLAAKDANGKTVEPFIVDGTTYLPVRAIGEAFDKDVNWDGTTNSVYVNTKASKEDIDKVAAYIEKEKANIIKTVAATTPEGYTVDVKADGMTIVFDLTLPADTFKDDKDGSAQTTFVEMTKNTLEKEGDPYTSLQADVAKGAGVSAVGATINYIYDGKTILTFEAK